MTDQNTGITAEVSSAGPATPYLPRGGAVERLVTLIDAAHAAGATPLLWGDAGIGKTAIIEELAKRPECAGMAKLSLNSMERTDMLGMPRTATADGGAYVTDYSDPRWVHQANQTPDGMYFYLVVDELTTADPDMQNTLLVPIQSREVASGTRLSDNIRVIMAANPSSLVDTVYDLNPTLANRLMHIDVVIDDNEWLTGLVEAWGRELTDAEAAVRRSMAAFLLQHPNLIQADPKEGDRSHAWPSRRSWDKAAAVAASLPERFLAGFTDDRPAGALVTAEESEMVVDVVSRFVGVTAASAYAEFLLTFRLPSPAEIVARPGECGIDWSDWVTAHVALSSVVSWVRDENTAKLAADVLTYAANATAYKDTATMMVQKFVDRCAALRVAVMPDLSAFAGFTGLAFR